MTSSSKMTLCTGLALLSLLLLLTSTPTPASAQENVQTRIPVWLTECYQTAAIQDRATRLPSNINILIELIRKVEAWPGMTMDIRELASTLVHRFRMDGIERAAGTFVPNVLPFSPSAFQFSKHRVLLARLISGSGAAFPQNSLTPQERCALHFMLSTSIERAARGDEAQTCNQLAQVRSMRIPRALVERPKRGGRRRRSVATPNNFLGDVELLQQKRHKKTARYMAADGEETTTELEPELREETADETVAEEEQTDPDGRQSEDGDLHIDFTDDDVESDGGQRNVEVLGAGITLSQCPLENGVLRTPWGAVSGGPLITGIAAGLQPQSVQTRDLLALSRAASQFHGARQQATVPARVDNRWAATLAGDLAEVTLLQGPMTQTIQVGGAGGWNATAVPRWYFLSQRDRLEHTDAEIRGGLDGLILAMNIGEWRNQFQQLRLSQLLDMYYSQRGVFSSNAQACNRRSLFSTVAPVAQIRAQTEAFSTVLDREMQMRVTLPQASIANFANAAAQALSTYIPQSLNDPSCAQTAPTRDATIWRAAADVYIYVDTAWQFREVQPSLSSLLESLDVNPFNSNYTLLNAQNAEVMVPSTSSLADFYVRWNNTFHVQSPAGLSLPNVMRSLRAIGRENALTEQRDSLNARGALVALVVPQQATVSEVDTNFALQELEWLNIEVPDMTLMFLAGGVAQRFERFVREPARDLYTLLTTSVDGTAVVTQMLPLVQRIQQAHRRILNPRCGPNWTQEGLGSHTLNQYVERGSVNFYRLLPNYFFQATQEDNRRIRIQGHGYAPITVCTSRWFQHPSQNQSTSDNDIACRTLLSDSLEVELRDYCSDSSIIHRCQPLFVSVAGAEGADTQQQFRCIDRDCRFPDNIRFSVTTENLGCFSAAGRVVGSLMLALVAFVLATWSM